MTTIRASGRVAPRPVRQEAAEIIRRVLAEVAAGRVQASPQVRAYLTGLADGLDR